MQQQGRFACIFFFLVLLLTTGCLYWSGLSGDYHYDDYHVLVYNPSLYLKDLTLSDLVRASSSFQAGGRELSMLSFVLNQYFLGDSAWGYKLVNVVIHCLNGLLLFVLLSRLVRIWQGGSQNSENALTGYIPFAAAALWLVHPMNLSAVLYISQRMTQLSTFFILLGLISYVWVRCENLPKLRRRVYPPLILLAYTAFGYNAKENAALLPVFALIIEFTILKFQSYGQRDRWIIMMYAVGMLSAVLLIMGKFWFDPQWLTEGYRHRFFSLEERVMTQFRVLVYYLANLIFPSNGSLSFWHDDISVSKGLFSPPTTLASLFLLLGILGTAIVSIKKFPMLALGLLWFFVSHLIESTLLPLELVHEHRNYLASFGIVLALVAVLGKLSGHRKKVLAGLWMGFFLFFSIVLGQRASIWGDDFRRAEHEARHHPESASANYTLARYYYAETLQDEGDDSVLKTLHYGKLASDYERYSIAPEILLMYLSGKTDIVSMDSVWMDRAVEKFSDHPYIVTSRQSLKDFVRCLARENCQIPQGGILPLIMIAEASSYPSLLTTAADYWQKVENDLDKAEQLYKKAWRRSSSITWINYIDILIRNGKTEQACDLYRKFRDRYEKGGFKDIMLQAHHILSLEGRLSSCLSTPQPT